MRLGGKKKSIIVMSFLNKFSSNFNTNIFKFIRIFLQVKNVRHSRKLEANPNYSLSMFHIYIYETIYDEYVHLPKKIYDEYDNINTRLV